MSRQAIRNALQTALNSITPALPTAWENINFTPPATPAGQAAPPYQKVWFIWATPDNSEFGPNYVELGSMQVTLMYAQGVGAEAVEERIALLRDAFPRGASFASGGIVTTITGTPAIGPTAIDSGRYAAPVRIPFRASAQN